MAIVISTAYSPPRVCRLYRPWAIGVIRQIEYITRPNTGKALFYLSVWDGLCPIRGLVPPKFPRYTFTPAIKPAHRAETVATGAFLWLLVAPPGVGAGNAPANTPTAACGKPGALLAPPKGG